MSSFLRIFRSKSPETSAVRDKYLTACMLYGRKLSQQKQEHIKCKIRTRLNLEYGIKKTRHRRIAPTKTIRTRWVQAW